MGRGFRTTHKFGPPANMAPLTIQTVIKALARLGDRKGSKYNDIQAAIPGGNTIHFINLVRLLHRAKSQGIVKQTAQGRWMLAGAGGGEKRSRELVSSASQLGRRRRRSKKGKGRRRRRGKKGKGKKGKKGKTGKKGKGKRR